MKRDIYAKLLQWKASPERKPLVLQGARQTGKTYILKEFGSNEYDIVMYCNFEENHTLKQFFHHDLNPRRILAELSLYFNQKIRPGSSLLIFDEIQISDRAFQSLNDFEKEVGDFHIVTSRSLIGRAPSASTALPGSHIDLLNLYPMTFFEFLDAMGESRYRRLLENISEVSPLTEIFHEDLNAILSQYMVVGGMPKAIQCFVDTGNITETRTIQKELLKSYVFDVVTYAPASDIHKITSILESVPRQLAKENSKFMFSTVKKGARAREYDKAIKWLEHAGLIHRAYAVQDGRVPLKDYADHNAFKVYALDIGLLGAMANSPVESQLQGNPLFSRHSGGFIASYAAQQLIAHSDLFLYYWKSKGGKAELDFLYEQAGHIYPIEIKPDLNTKSKCLQSYRQQFSPTLSIRSNLLNLKKDGEIHHLPLYALSLLPQLISQEISLL